MSKEKPAKEVVYPKDPGQWETRHTLLVLARIERWWNRVPVSRRNAARPLVADILGQRDVEEVGRG